MAGASTRSIAWSLRKAGGGSASGETSVILNKSFFAMTAAFLAMFAGAISVVVALTIEPMTDSASAVAFACGLIAAALLYGQSRRDLDPVLTLIAVFSLSTAICIGIYVYYAQAPSRTPKIAATVCALIGATLGYLTYRRQHDESPDFPDILGRQFGPARLLETNGIQFSCLRLRTVSPLNTSKKSSH
jgi:hypothetical protein